ncbi:general transcription factor 3C polypeptide 1 [Notolabrus celidotus]|uniref:general transcription factor 3C polypeptide 1 n=1 Tax=Notolabrus celidotus TaxID=1203425 RepID=UPI00148FD205|nr:general transcription factor 3C polypeptide 1 [Notolabrus celidotus]
MDPLSLVADEVALEGLDGITLPSLWIRLEDRKPKFPLQLDDCTKELLWKSLLSNSDLKFYELPQERDDVELTDRFKDIDPETGIETTQRFSDTQRDIYPVHILLDNKDGIQGSCAVLKERKEITKLVRSKSFTPTLTLQEALERYGRKLVVVASQVLRFRTLIGIESDPDLKLTDDSYCVLERIGRARRQGELQRDLHRCSFKIDARKVHYLRKSLVKNGLITVQSYVTRARSGQQQHSVLLLLKRFHVNRRSKYDLLMEYVSNLLQQMPGQFTTLMSLRQQLNVNDGTFKRMFQYMRSAKLAEYCMYPLEDLDPAAGPCTNKKGKKVMVRCLKLLKPYSKKNVTDDDDDDDEDDEDDSGARRRATPAQGRIMETDILSQAYQLVLSSGTNGIAKSTIAFKMNIGKLESRMICRTLERAGVIKGFMVDEGRQRTTKFISHKSVGVSDQLQRFAKEQERNKLLSSSSSQTPESALASPAAASTSKSRAEEKSKTPAKQKGQKAGRGGKRGAEENGEGGKGRGKAGGRGKAAGKNDGPKTTEPEEPVTQPVTAESETPDSSKPLTPDSASNSRAEPGQVEAEEEERSSSPVSSLPQAETLNAAEKPEENSVEVVKEQTHSHGKSSKRSPEGGHETYRLLRRKNLIVEAVRHHKVIEGTFPLQKMINDEEKQNCSTRCCKKTILRLTQSLSRQGLIKIYKTTIVQDGITKNVEMFVHPSILPSDDIVKRVIEQVRFRISSSYAAVRLQQAEERAKQLEKDKKRYDDRDFKPTPVRGLGKSLGFQPKMHRLRVIHNFLWYLIYGHPLRKETPGSSSDSQTPANTSENSAEPQTAESKSKLDVMSSGDEDEEQDKSEPGTSQKKMTVYADEESWRRFVPPVCVHKEYGTGWAMVSDLLLCLPLSVFIQVIQINYKVDGLEEYLSDPEKQHHLVRTLPAKMKRQLLYRRKYIFLFHENLQRLVYMGLVQFGPVEKFKDKDLVFLYLKRNATIVDSTSSEPHYWLVSESPDKPFERRRYTFNTAEDVENYWFDLMCVCLNTPLGVIRNKRNAPVDVTAPSFVHDRYVFAGLAYLLKGSCDVSDEGLIPGDGKGAGGLDSEFFSHLKRNWLWTNHLLAVKTAPTGTEAKQTKIRLRSLLSRNALRIALTAGGTTAPRCVTNKRSVMLENVKVGIEPAIRNKQVVGGKGQKRKRSKKEVVKPPPKKKKEPKKRTPAHDEADHRALKMMTRQRVLWSVQEDSLMMLCSVASQLLNSKLKRPFIPHCVVRDLLHTEFEISVDKTSVAVGRRSRYILKNPQTLLNYRICLAEVYEDKPLMKMLEEKKPVDPDSPEDCATAFSEYVRLLREKFSSALGAGLHDVVMPNTKHELFTRFRVSAIEHRKQLSRKDTLTCTDDIHAIVLHNLIQSTLAMTNIQMKSSRSFQTFHMYSKYSQELLCQVFIQCRKRGLVNRRRVNQPFGPKKNRALPILPMSYQLSHSYYRCFSWRFPNSLCTDSFRFMRTLINNGTADDKPFATFYHEPENRSAHGEIVTEGKSVSEEKKKRSKVKTTSRPVSETEVQPEEGNSDPAKEGENNQENLEGEEKLVEVNDEKPEMTGEAEEQKNPEDSSTVGTGEDQPITEETQDPLPEGASSDSLPEASEADVSDMLRFSLDSPGGACVASLSLMSLGLLSVHLSIPRRMVVVDSTMVDNDVVKSLAALDEEDDEDEDGEDCDGKKKLQVKAHQASHTNYLMLRGYCSPGIVQLRNLNTSDNIVLESCNMKVQLRNTPAHHTFSKEIADSPPLDMIKYGPSLVPSILTRSTCCSFSSSASDVTECENRLVEGKGYTPQDVEACARIRKSLEEAGESGMDIQDLHQTHRHLEEQQCGRTRGLQQYLKELQEEGQVLQVGSFAARWVLTQHAEPWLLTLNCKQWSQSRSSSDKLTFLQRQHNFPFMRKRCRRGFRREKEEPPAKKLAVDRQEDEDREDVEAVSTDVKRDEGTQEEQPEKQKESLDDGTEEKVLNAENEGEKQLLLEEEGGKETEQEKVEIEERRGKRRERRARKGSIDEDTAADDHDADENLSFISRPWRMVDGSLNRPVCKGMLEGLLYHIMYRPGLTQRSLVEHYKALLQPMAVLDLLEALISLGCVKKKTVVKAPKPSLFTRSVPQTRSETQVMIEDPDSVFYEPTISCSLRLPQVLPNERNWNTYLP